MFSQIFAWFSKEIWNNFQIRLGKSQLPSSPLVQAGNQKLIYLLLKIMWKFGLNYLEWGSQGSSYPPVHFLQLWSKVRLQEVWVRQRRPASVTALKGELHNVFAHQVTPSSRAKKKTQTRILQKNRQARQEQESRRAQNRALLAEQSCCNC